MNNQAGQVEIYTKSAATELDAGDGAEMRKLDAGDGAEMRKLDAGDGAEKRNEDQRKTLVLIVCY